MQEPESDWVVSRGLAHKLQNTIAAAIGFVEIGENVRAMAELLAMSKLIRQCVERGPKPKRNDKNGGKDGGKK